MKRALLACGLVALLFGIPVLGVALAESHSEASEAERVRAPVAGASAEIPSEDFPGVLLTPDMANLSARSESRVLEVKVRAGQAVRKGDVIVAFDLRAIRQELDIARAEFAAAGANLRSARSAQDAARSKAARRDASVEVAGRRVALVSAEEASQSKFDAQSANAERLAAEARVAEQRAHVQQLLLTLEEGELRAPFDGVVAAVNIEPGSTAHVGEVAARVVGGKGLRVRIAVPDTRAALVSARSAELRVDGRSFRARIEHASPEPEPYSRAFVLEGSVELSDDGADEMERATLAGRAVRARFLP